MSTLNPIFEFLRGLSWIGFVLTIPISADLYGASLVNTQAKSIHLRSVKHGVNTRYTGCARGREFVPGRLHTPGVDCKITLDEKICKIAANDCCFRQCVFRLTKQTTDLDNFLEANLFEQVVVHEAQKMVRGTINGASGKIAESTADSCINACMVTVKAKDRKVAAKTRKF